MLRALTCLLLCLLMPAIGHARQLPFRHLGLAEGLAQTSGDAIAQGPDGLLWLGTEAGLQRYDGYDFIDYHNVLGDAGSLSQDDVRALAVAADGTVWVGTNRGGLNRLAPGGKAFRHFRHAAGDPRSLASDRVNDLLLDRRGRLWVAGRTGVDRLRASGDGFSHFALPGVAPGRAEAFALVQDRHGRVWVGSEGGLLYVDEAHARLVRFVPAGAASQAARAALAAAWVSSLLESRDGSLWVGTNHGLFVLGSDGKLRAWLRHEAGVPASLADDRVSALAEAAGGSIWVGTAGSGLDRLDPAGSGWSVQHLRHDDADAPDGLSNDNVVSLFVDATGLLWVGTYGGGFDVVNTHAQAFDNVEHRADDPDSIASDIVWAIQRDARGAIWVGTEAGLTRLGARPGDVQHYRFPGTAPTPGSGAVYGLSVDADQRLWVVATSGLYRNAGPGTPFAPVALQLPAGGSAAPVLVNALLRDAQGRLWATSNAGLLQLDSASGRVLARYQDGTDAPIARAVVSPICQTADGVLWLGTQVGVLRFDPGQARFLPPPAAAAHAALFTAADVLSCLATPGGDLWIGTTAGLVQYRVGVGVVRIFDTADGMPSSNMYALARDAPGAIWVGTGRGLTRIQPDTGALHTYGRANGLRNIEFNQMAALAADGMLYFGGIHGLTTVRPAQLRREDQPAARVAITGYTTSGTRGSSAHRWPPAGPLALQYWQSAVTFDLAVLDFTAPRSNTFRYRLLRFDAAWHELHGSHQVTYTSLDPGTYTLEVTGSDSSGHPAANTVRLQIEARAPPWLRPWAWVGYFLLGVLLVALGLYLFARYLRRRHDLRHAQERLHWAEQLRELDYAIAQLDDEAAIAREVMARLPELIPHAAAALLDVVDAHVQATTSRGFTDAELVAVQDWTRQCAEVIAPLCQYSRVVTPGDATLAATGLPARLHYLLLPFTGTRQRFQCLLVARRERPFASARVDLAGILARQVGVVMRNAELIRQLAAQARFDNLTGASNRAWFREQAEAAFAACRRHAHAISMFMLDVDHFKAVNDSHGHAAGDAVLSGLVRHIRAELRGNDIVARYGGEEFLVCLPETDYAAACLTAERLRSTVAGTGMATPAGPIHITVSIGVSSVVPTAADSLDALITSADRAMYVAKRDGRNRVHGAEAPATPIPRT